MKKLLAIMLLTACGSDVFLWEKTLCIKPWIKEAGPFDTTDQCMSFAKTHTKETFGRWCGTLSDMAGETREVSEPCSE